MKSVQTSPHNAKPGASTDKRNENEGRKPYEAGILPKAKKSETRNVLENFIQPRYNRFFTISAKEKNINLSAINTIKAYKDLTKHMKGEVKKITETRQGTLAIEVNNEAQSISIETLTRLDNTEVKVESDDRLNRTRATIRYPNYPNHSIETITENLAPFGVIHAHQMTRKKGDDIENLPIYILTFKTTYRPPHVMIGWTRCPTRLYIPRPRRCYKCQKYGHGSKSCRSAEEVCPKCAAPKHEGECVSPIKCSNCNQDHPSYDKKCFHYQKEQEILSTQAREQITFIEARKIVNDRYVKQNRTFAAVTAANNQKTPTQQNPNKESSTPITKPKTADPKGVTLSITTTTQQPSEHEPTTSGIIASNTNQTKKTSSNQIEQQPSSNSSTPIYQSSQDPPDNKKQQETEHKSRGRTTTRNENASRSASTPKRARQEEDRASSPAKLSKQRLLSPGQRYQFPMPPGIPTYYPTTITDSPIIGKHKSPRKNKHYDKNNNK